MRGQCHCGTVKFEVTLTDGLRTARRCNCSYCRMRGAIAVTVNIDGLHIREGQQSLSLYEFNTRTAKHYFCSKCGIYTHHQRRSNPNQFGVNVACLVGVSPFDFECVPVMEGNNHPSDHKNMSPSQVAGTLRYIRSTEN